jgi:1,4-dihydroxy-2-naphthoate octaprenyltransferase
MGTTAFNTYFDYVRNVDSNDWTRERDKILLSGDLEPVTTLWISLGLYALAGILGLVLAALSSWWLVPVGAAGMVVGFLYNAGPLPISRTPLGELFAGGFLGSVVFLVAYFVQALALSPEAVAASIPSLLMVAAILTVNNTCDIEGDRQAGRRTLSVLVGRGGGIVVIGLLFALAHLLLVGLALSRVLPIYAGFGAVVSLSAGGREYVQMIRRGFSHETKSASMGSILGIFATYSVVYAVGLGLGILFG